MKNVHREVLKAAKKELEETGTLTKNTQTKVKSIARKASPKNWPKGNSQKKQAYILLRKANKNALRRWSYTFHRRYDSWSEKEKNKQKNGRKQSVERGKNYLVGNALREALTISHSESFPQAFKKALYAPFGKYSFLEDIVGNETVQLIKGVQRNDEVSISRLVEKKTPYFAKKLSKDISWEDRKQIAAKAIYTAAKKALFVGGFNKYILFHITRELSNYYADTPKNDLVPFSHRLETEIADVHSIRAFDDDTYETLLEQSEIANRNSFINLGDGVVPYKLLKRFNKLISDEGKSMKLFMKAFKEELLSYQKSKKDFVASAQQKIISLFHQDALQKGKQITREVVENTLQNVIKKYNNEHLYADEEPREEFYALFLKERKRIITKEVKRLLSEQKKAIQIKEQYHNVKYLHLLARTLTDVEEVISYSNLLATEEERISEIKSEAVDTAKYVSGFEAMPWEFKKAAVLAKINNTHFWGPTLDPSAMRNYCLHEEDLESLAQFGDVKTILARLYQEEIILSSSIGKGVFKAGQRNPSEAFNEWGVVAFNNHPLLQEASAPLSSKSHQLEEIIITNEYTCAFLTPIISSNLDSWSYSFEDSEEKIKKAKEKLEQAKKEAITVVKEYEKNNVPVPPLVRNIQGYFDDDLKYSLEMRLTDDNKVIISPEAFYTFNNKNGSSWEVEEYFENERERLEQKYANEKQKEYAFTAKMLERLNRFWTRFLDPDDPTPKQLLAKFDDWGSKKVREIGDFIEEARKERAKNYEIEQQKIHPEEEIDKSDYHVIIIPRKETQEALYSNEEFDKDLPF